MEAVLYSARLPLGSATNVRWFFSNQSAKQVKFASLLVSVKTFKKSSSCSENFSWPGSIELLLLLSRFYSLGGRENFGSFAAGAKLPTCLISAHTLVIPYAAWNFGTVPRCRVKEPLARCSPQKVSTANSTTQCRFSACTAPFRGAQFVTTSAITFLLRWQVFPLLSRFQ